MLKRILLFLIVVASANCLYSQNNAYIIQRGDVLDVTIMEHPEFSLGGIIVLPDGYVQYPALGSIKVAGMSSEQLTDSLQKALEKYVVNPMATIFIRKIQNHQVNIFGYVNKPGQYQLFESIDLYAAIGLAGGLKSFKKITSITIIRANRTVEMVDLRTLFQSDLKNTAIPMVNIGDTVYVKEPKEVNWSKLSFFTTILYTAVAIITIVTR